MDTKDTLQKIESKKIKPVDFIYLGVILLFFIITAVMFFTSTNFIIGHINKIFLPVEEVANKPLDMERYRLIEKKLNLPSNIPGEIPAINTPLITTATTPVIPATITAPVNTKVVTTPTVNIDKKSISINILNGSKKAGVASLLSNNLEKAGFSKSSTGDNGTVIPITTIYIKDSKKDYISSIQDVVKKSYPKTITKINPENSNFDVIIITGK